MSYLLIATIVLCVLLVIHRVYTRLYADGLSHIPGPKINALSRIPYARHLLKGDVVDNVLALHEKYGDIVRLSPNQVSFTCGESAFPDIYGFRTGKMKGHLSMQKDPVWYTPPPNGAPSILIADDENHTRGRRLLSHAFSEKALAEQEPLVQKYVDQLVDGLKETRGQSYQDVTKWMNWTTFDIIADLVFGEPFGCLQDQATHKHITLLFKATKAFRFHYIRTHYPIVNYLGSLIVDKDLISKRAEFLSWVSNQVQNRLDRETQRPDFITHIMAHQGEKGLSLSKNELDSNANLILIAGSETTATLLSAATYLILTNPRVHRKLTTEIRALFKDYNDITLAAANQYPYLLAVLSESLRIFPPVPAGFERQVNKGGEIISGVFIPEGTGVSVSHYPAYHSESNFKNANAFVPERWLDDRPKEYENDKRSAWQPFSFGPRNCIGKNLAYAEMRLIMAKILWTFDMELDEQSRDWRERCKVFTLWEKPELNVRFREVVR